MKKKILIIDDCLAILDSLRMILEMHHYDVEISQNGAYSLGDNDVLPDVILADYHTPDVDELGLFKQLKNNAHLEHIPVILMSGDIDIERLSIFLGVADFIAKPFNLVDLLNKIEGCISYKTN